MLLTRIYVTLCGFILFIDEIFGLGDEIHRANTHAAKEVDGGLFVEQGEYAPDYKELLHDESKVRLFEGDIVYTPEIQRMLEGISLYEAKPNAQWTDGVIPYIVENKDGDHHHFEELQETVKKATAEYHKYLKGCITWKEYHDRHDLEHDGIHNFISFYYGPACFSTVGMIGGEQKLSLGKRCHIVGIAMHEMMHALGFWHEQARKDRDTHVEIVWDNVKKRSRHSFAIKETGESMNEPYDINSIMHYNPKSFSKNRQITIVDKGGKERFGQRRGFSRIDILQIRKFYKCDVNAPIPELASEKVRVRPQRPSKLHHGARPRPSTHHKPKYFLGDSHYKSKSPRRRPIVRHHARQNFKQGQIGGVDISRIFHKKGGKRLPVDGGYSQWSEFSPCTKTCGGGIQRKIRKCNNPAPRYGGKWCVGINAFRTHCNSQRCNQIIHGRYSQWSEWDECSKTCGGGLTRRRRECNNPAPENGGRHCIGGPLDIKPCNQISCPVDGGLGPWSEYGECTKTCDGGIRIKTRKCDQPTPKYGGKYCTGDLYKTDLCNVTPCDAACVDKHEKCHEYIHNCLSYNHLAYMLSVCKKTCGFCYRFK